MVDRSESPFLFKPSDFFESTPDSKSSSSASLKLDTYQTPKATPLKTDSSQNLSSNANDNGPGQVSLAKSSQKSSRAETLMRKISQKRNAGLKTSAINLDIPPQNVSFPEIANDSFSSGSELRSPESVLSSVVSPPENVKSAKKDNPSSHKRGPKPSIGLFWDIENCRVPPLKSEMSYINWIRDKFCQNYICDEFICVCAVDSLADRTCEELNNAQVTLAHVPSGAKNAADEKLRQKIRRFGELFAHKNAAAILITGDINFISDITDLRHRCGVQVILIHNDHTNEQLKSVANQTCLHEQILKEIPDKVAKDGMQYVKHELIVRNLPNSQSEMNLRNKLSRLVDNCGGKVLFVNPAKGFAFVGFSSPETCERACVRLQNKDVFGNKIQVEIAMRQSNSMYLMNNMGGGSILANPPLLTNNYHNEMIQSKPYTSPKVSQPPPPLLPNYGFNINIARQNVPMSNFQLLNNKNNSEVRDKTRKPHYQNITGHAYGNSGSLPRNWKDQKYHGTSSFGRRNDHNSKSCRIPPKYNLIKDSDVNALEVEELNGLNCVENEIKIRQLLKIALKTNRASAMSFKSMFSSNEGMSSKFAVCFSSEKELTDAITEISTIKHKDLNFAPKKGIFQDEDLEDLKINVLALLDTDRTQLHTFILSYWQKFEKFIKPSLLNYLIEDLIEVEEYGLNSQQKMISLKSGVSDLENNVMTFEYIKAAPGLSPDKDTTPEAVSDSLVSSFSMLNISDDNTAFKVDQIYSKRFKNQEKQFQGSQPDYSNYILYKNYDPMPFHRCPMATAKYQSFKRSKFCFKVFSEQVYELVSEHGGYIPMSQFLNCYQYIYGTLPTESKISFEQLLISVDGISTFLENDKCVCFSSLDMNYKECFSDVRAPFPTLPTNLKDFTNEVIRQLEMAEKNNYQVPVSQFLKNYYETKGREFDASRYGYQDARELFSACRGFFSVIGIGVNQIICYSRRMNTKRFGAFLRHKIRASAKDLVGAVRKLKFDPVDYGFYSVEEFCKSNWIQLAMTTQQRNDSINLDLVSNSEKDISNFTLRVFAVMSSVNKQTVTYEEFLNFFQEKFNRPVKACDFGFTDLKELLLATEMVWIFDSVENQKSIVMRPLIQLLHELVEIMRKTKLPVGLTELAQIYNMTKQRELSCFKYGFPSLTKLLESLPMFISMYN